MTKSHDIDLWKKNASNSNGVHFSIFSLVPNDFLTFSKEKKNTLISRFIKFTAGYLYSQLHDFSNFSQSFFFRTLFFLVILLVVFCILCFFRKCLLFLLLLFPNFFLLSTCRGLERINVNQSNKVCLYVFHIILYGTYFISQPLLSSLPTFSLLFIF